jgi:single-stranded-DNA-specific exonuclease
MLILGANTMDKKWILSDPIPEDCRAKLQRWEAEPVLQQLFWNRNLTSEEDAMEFVRHQIPQDTDPYMLADMTSAVERILIAVDAGELIAVYGDYDVDGVTATLVLKQGLEAYGAQTITYIPDRHLEGYGIHSAVLEKFAEQGVALVISVDCGISAFAEVEKASELGMDFIVTDHHQIGSKLPEALAVINPQRPDCAYPENILSAVGISYKMVDALWSKRLPKNNSKSVSDFLDLVALGTVADLAPLIGENRYMVQVGLDIINANPRIGIKALLGVSRSNGSVSAQTIAFQLGPRINAVGRIGDASRALSLLATENDQEAIEIAQELEKYNRERQRMTRDMTSAAMELSSQTYVAGDSHILFAEHEDFHNGLVGLVASRLCQTYYLPAVVGQRKEGYITGSARSIAEFHISNAFKECSHLLERYGGHAAAAGFTIKEENWAEFVEHLENIAEDGLKDVDLRPVLHIDAEVKGSDITQRLANQQSFFEPSGMANPQPLFIWRGARIQSKRHVGRDDKHLKLKFESGQNGSLDAIAFGLGDRYDDLTDEADLVFALEINEWNGHTNKQLNVKDIRPSE